jgi:hypothetical protein
MDLPMAAELTHVEGQTKRRHAKAKDAVHTNFAPWHGICSGMLKMKGRNEYSKTLGAPTG